MRRQRTRFLPVLALLAGLVPSMLSAQAGTVRGTWNLNRQQSDDLNAAINRSVARMNVIVRQIARPRLRSTNSMYPTIAISQDAGNVRVNMAGRIAASPANGSPVLWQRETGGTCREVKGDCVRVTSEMGSNGHLTQAFQAEDGRRVNVYSVSPDGNTLTMNVTITSPKLPQPLTYKLVYNRGS